ncbi:hypothetical protein RBG61_01810 [Paludicola sp. MB14-C6]|uniref:hypothetical protein n=1 Tax=Paludihabitans sp. MB14-C6 TaxID=3070656 RepID=UPI0027DB9998|nr:hypothetical protein [Paludicola sp. MB14-C6]WMJ23427.1 hypothetical protein RBG61_01810 [Paludicola sp. MB14-C6]
MNNIKKKLMIVSLLLLLLFIALAPILLTEINNQNLINKPNIVTISTESTERSHSNNNFSTMERICTIVNANNQKTGIITEQKKLNLSEQQVKEIFNKMQYQIKNLQNQSVLPSFDIAENYNKIDISKRMYVEAIDSNEVVSTWEIMLDNDAFSIRAVIDVNTSIIYEISIFSRIDKQGFDVSRVETSNYFKYLNIESNIMSFKPQAASLSWYYNLKINDNQYVTFNCIVKPYYIEYNFIR